MTPQDYKIARKLKRKRVKVVKVLDFRVFGSRARGGIWMCLLRYRTLIESLSRRSDMLPGRLSEQSVTTDTDYEQN